MLTILAISEIIPADVPGGSGRAAWESALEFVRRGHRVVVVTRNIARKAARECIEGATVLRFSRFITLYCRTASILREFKPDCICLHSPFPSIAFRRFARRLPSLYFFHSPWHEEFEIRGADLKRNRLHSSIGSFLRKRAERSVLASVDGIVVDSKFMAQRLLHHHRHSATVIPLGVDLKRFCPGDKNESRNRLNIPGNRLVLLTVRNLVSRMGIDTLIDAMPAVVRAFPEALLLVGGKGYLHDALQKRTTDLGIASQVRLLGYIPEEHLVDYYRSADIFILPTKSLEGFGLVTLESLACGTPVLATPAGANQEILSALDPRMVFAGCGPDDIAQGTVWFLREYQKCTHEMRAKCFSFARNNFSWKKCVDGILETLQPVLSGKTENAHRN